MSTHGTSGGSVLPFIGVAVYTNIHTANWALRLDRFKKSKPLVEILQKIKKNTKKHI